jgi:hypothetical protein
MRNDPPSAGAPACPLSREGVIQRYFLEHRAKLIDLAAFLDRVDRAAQSTGTQAAEDHRLQALHQAIGLLTDGKPERTRRILEVLSDPTRQPLVSAEGLPPVAGAYDPQRTEGTQQT